MTEFDVDATPFCDFLDLDGNARDWKEIARLIERRARLAEERLRITNEMLSIIYPAVARNHSEHQDSINRIFGFRKVSE